MKQERAFREKLEDLKKLNIELIDVATALRVSLRTVERAKGNNGFPRKRERIDFLTYYNSKTGRL